MARKKEKVQQRTLGRILTNVSWKVCAEGLSAEQAVSQVLAEVPKEDLGRLILEADSFINPFPVASRIGVLSIRYPESWESCLRDMLSSIITAALALDYH